MSDSRETGKGRKDDLDMRLLSEAVVELNVSRRSVGLYPPGHSFVTNSVNRAYDFLREILEGRPSITLGIAKDSVIVGEHTLDENVPAFREFALSYHAKGIASITFKLGLTVDELVAFHQITTSDSAPAGAELVELAEKKGIANIKLTPIDISSFKFIEGTLREGGGSGYGEDALWREYVRGVLDGNVTTAESQDMLLSIPPEEVAVIINEAIPEKLDGGSCERVINSYIRSTGEFKLSPETINKLFMLINNLSEGLRQQFLSKTFESVTRDAAEVERALDELAPETFNSVVKFFADFSSMMPNTLKQVIEKLSVSKAGKGFGFDMVTKDGPVVHDIELDDELGKMFKEDTFQRYVSEEYRDDLWAMLRKAAPINKSMLEELARECSEEVVDRYAAQSMIEVLESDRISRENYLAVVTRLVEQFGIFIDTGRFGDALNIYIAIHSQSFGGRFRHEASSTLRYALQSEKFISRLIESAKISGRTDREGFVRLARALKQHIITPLLDDLEKEEDSVQRKFLLTVLGSLGSDVVPEVLARLKDERWYVLRNMICLVKKCGSAKDADEIRKFAKHPDIRVSTEAVDALLHFKTQDSVPFLKAFLRSNDLALRNRALKLAAAHRVKEAVPLLTELLLKRDMLGAETFNKKPIIAALARIGDEKALDAFDKIMRSMVLLYKDGLKELKLEILRNLDGFSSSRTMPLLVEAVSSKNEEIKSLGEKIVREAAARKKGKRSASEGS